MTLNDIFLLLKSSDKINHDLSCPFEHCVDVPEDCTDDVEYSIGLQQFAQLKPISEFRSFIREGKLLGTEKILTTMGLEPTIFRFEVGRLIHWATRPSFLTENHLVTFKYFLVL